ncbi:ADP-ribose pyrophosphatase [Thermoanaerobacter kivui]|uniref:ADP-ribose pyrophosphatase n=1 Tax=Thermoanaerobacter kivui TaxID=2325 RepID=A0A097AUW9_THEKI|nr:NUDIX hydrolase [Thermoanaerobacter kivui]AIS53590.1 ADP-ribose pyrophosphatase [Thermoanaerobacter kivui]
MVNFRASFLVARVVVVENEKVLLVKHQDGKKVAWVFPGGRVEENESVAAAAIRECKEETGYEVKLNGVCYIQEYDIYYVTYFYSTIIGGKLALGSDPELPKNRQVLKEVKWIDFKDLKNYEVYPKKLAELIQQKDFFNCLIPIPETFL